MKSLKLYMPTVSVELTPKQLRTISMLLLMGYSEIEFLLKSLMYLTGLKLVRKKDGRAHWYKHRSLKKPFLIDSEIMVNMAQKCRFLLEIGEIKPIPWIKFSRARHYRLYNACFEEYLMAENYYFAYIETRNSQHLCNLMAVLYRRPWKRWDAEKIQKRAKIFRNVSPVLKNCVFMWYIGFRVLVAKRCPNLFSGEKTDRKFNTAEYINGMIHQLNNGDITLNKKLYRQPVWEALNEMEMRAMEANIYEERLK